MKNVTTAANRSGEARRKPSLLLIAHTYVVHEHAKKLPELARHFDLTCVTIPPKDYGTTYGVEAERFGGWMTPEGYTLIALPALGRAASVTKFILRGLVSVIRSRPWDFVLVENEPWSLLKMQSLLASRLFGNVGHYGEFTWENVKRPGAKGAVLSLFYRATAWWADFVVAGNRAAAEIVKGYGMPAERVTVCPQVGVDVVHHHPLFNDDRAALRAQWSLPANAFVVGFAGRFVEEKGIRDVLEAIATLPADRLGGERGVHYALIGHGPLQQELLKRSDEGWVHLRSAVPHHELSSFLQCLDLMILGSHPVRNGGTCWEEQFGHSMIEAAACGALALGSTSGAIPEVLGDPDLTFAPGDVPAIRGLIERFSTDANYLQEKKASQRARLLRHYTHAAVADRCAQFLLSLPDRSAKPLQALPTPCPR